MGEGHPAVGTTRLGPVEEYQIADLEMLPAGNSFALVCVRDGRDARYLRAEVADLLMRCQEFRTLDDHLRAYQRERGINAAGARALRRELQKLARSGHLVSRSDVLGRLREPVEQNDMPGIASVGFPTRDRVGTLERALTSYIENGRSFDRAEDFVVADSSLGAAARDAYRQMLRDLKYRYGVSISYAGHEEKLAFAQKLAEVGDLPPDIVRFACEGDERYDATTVGANRNALLLHTVGDLFLSADDDTECMSAAPRRQRKGIAFASRGFPANVRFFRDRAAALRAVDLVESDALVPHEHWLGKDPKSNLSESIADHEVSLEQAEPRLLRKLKTQPGRVAVTVSGTVGDCAWDDPHFYMFRPEVIERAARSEEEHRVARGGREVAQAVDQATVTDKTYPMLAMCIGLDNRGLLPPFAPVGRAEEVTFGAVLSKCYRAQYAVHLPWLVLHSPPQQRSFPPRHIFAVGPRLISFCVEAFDPGYATTPAERLRKLGAHLEELGRLPKDAFEEFVRWRNWTAMSSRVSALEEQFRGVGEKPSGPLAHDSRELIAMLRRSALDPIDRLYELEGGREALQDLVVSFGRLVGHWPQMVDTARRLREAGLRLAQPV